MNRLGLTRWLLAGAIFLLIGWAMSHFGKNVARIALVLLLLLVYRYGGHGRPPAPSEAGAAAAGGGAGPLGEGGEPAGLGDEDGRGAPEERQGQGLRPEPDEPGDTTGRAEAAG